MIEQGASIQQIDQRIEDYRSGYSAGWSDGKNGEPLQDLAKARLFFGQQVSPEVDDPPCSECGCEERDHRGILTCRCPARLASEPHQAPAGCHWAQEDTPDGDIYWDTQCGEAFICTDGTPTDNRMTFCPFCGGSIVYKLPPAPSLPEGDQS